MCHGTHMEIREYFMEADSLLHVSYRAQTQILRLWQKYLKPLSHHTALDSFLYY